MSSKSGLLTVFYDGGCVVCAHEIGVYRRKDVRETIRFVDINRGDFDPDIEGLDAEKVRRTFHVRKPTGELVEGHSAFVEIWNHLKIFRYLVGFANTKFGDAAMRIGYKGFTMIRPYLPRYKHCGTDACVR